MDSFPISLEAIITAIISAILAFIVYVPRISRWAGRIISYLPEFREVMHAGDEGRVAQPNINARTVDMLDVLLREIAEIRKDNLELQAKLNECVGTGLDDRIEEKLNGHSTRPKSSPSLSSRNAKIRKARKSKSAREVAKEFGLSETHIYRICRAA